MRYKADNNKIINTDKMVEVLSTSSEGCYGQVYKTLYVTPRSRNYYLITESGWAGDGAISDAQLLTKEQAAEMIMLHDPDDIGDYPELKDCLEEVTDQ